MKRLNRKGFTLVELLAVIVILGVIMLIAIPSVGTIIKNARFNSFVSSGKMYISTAQNYIAAEVNISPNQEYYLSIYELNGNKLNKSPITSDFYINGYVKVEVADNGNPTYTAYICETIAPYLGNAPACPFTEKTYEAVVKQESGRDVVKLSPIKRSSAGVDYPYPCPAKEQWLTAHKWISGDCGYNPND